MAGTRWACRACTFLNVETHLCCDVCATPRSEVVRPPLPVMKVESVAKAVTEMDASGAAVLPKLLGEFIAMGYFTRSGLAKDVMKVGVCVLLRRDVLLFFCFVSS